MSAPYTLILTEQQLVDVIEALTLETEVLDYQSRQYMLNNGSQQAMDLTARAAVVRATMFTIREATGHTLTCVTPSFLTP